MKVVVHFPPPDWPASLQTPSTDWEAVDWPAVLDARDAEWDNDDLPGAPKPEPLRRSFVAMLLWPVVAICAVVAAFAVL